MGEVAKCLMFWKLCWIQGLHLGGERCQGVASPDIDGRPGAHTCHSLHGGESRPRLQCFSWVKCVCVILSIMEHLGCLYIPVSPNGPNHAGLAMLAPLLLCKSSYDDILNELRKFQKHIIAGTQVVGGWQVLLARFKGMLYDFPVQKG